MKTDDATIIAQILAGETKEFRHLMRRHGGTLLAFIESVIGSREEAEDIVQETFINAFRSLRQYDDSKASFAKSRCRDLTKPSTCCQSTTRCSYGSTTKTICL